MKTITVQVKASRRSQPKQFRLRVEQQDERFIGQPAVHRHLYEMARRGCESDRVGEVNSGRGLYQLVRGEWFVKRRVGTLEVTAPEADYLKEIAGAIIFESMYETEVTVTCYQTVEDLEAAWDEATEEMFGAESREYDRFAATWSRSLPSGCYDGGD